MSPARRVTGPAVRLIAFYVVVAAALVVLARVAPELHRALSLTPTDAPAVGQLKDAIRNGETAIAPTWTAILVAILGSLLFSLPVAWTYTVTKRDEGYDKSVVQMIVMLPVAVAAVVLVVFGKLSLAFALAGIVAAVRFRTTLKDVKDAVFAFVAIGIGLAAGIQSIQLAALLSLVFSALALALWALEIGEAGRGPLAAGPMTLGDALVPGSTESLIRVGEAELLAPLGAEEMRALSPHQAEVRRLLREDAVRPKGKYRYALLVFTRDAAAAQSFVAETLERRAKRWTLALTAPAGEGTFVLIYLMRLAKGETLDSVVGSLQDSSGLMRGVEVRDVKAFRKQIE